MTDAEVREHWQDWLPPVAPDPLRVGLTKLSLRPGDVLVLTVPEGTTGARRQHMAEQIGALLPPGVNHVVTMPSSHSLTVLRNDSPVEPEVEPAVVVEVGR